MNTITIQVEKSSLECTENKLITGIIYFDFGRCQFPENDWNDFIVIILNWWLSALTRIALGVSDSENLQFMDGPLFVKVKKMDADMCNIECINESRGGSLKFSGHYQIEEVLNSVLQAAKTTSDICSENRWGGDDIVELREGIINFPKI